MRGRPPIHIIIDAVNKYPDASEVVSRDRALELVEKLIASHLPKLPIYLTSHLEADIRDVRCVLVADAFSVSAFAWAVRGRQVWKV
jgi:hypothetical protein